MFIATDVQFKYLSFRWHFLKMLICCLNGPDLLTERSHSGTNVEYQWCCEFLTGVSQIIEMLQLSHALFC